MTTIYLILQGLFLISIILFCILFLALAFFGKKRINLQFKSIFFVFLTPALLFFLCKITKPNLSPTVSILDPYNFIQPDPLKLLNTNYKFAKEIITQNEINPKNLELTKSVESQIQKNDNITKILQPFNVSDKQIFELDKYLTENQIFNFNKIKQNDTYALLFSKDSINQLLYFGYELNRETYLFINLHDTLEAKIKKRPFQIKRHKLAGIIESSLWNTLDDFLNTNREIDAVGSVLAEDIYPWSIDFYRLVPEDRFKIIYDAKYINDEFVEIDNVFAAVFMHNGKNYYGFPFKEKHAGLNIEYYDEKGDNLRNFFFQAPVSYKRISSKYSKSRRHPVTGRVKAHKGTDFAAEKGSKIYSTADGVITAATYKKYNGYYVKIRHNSTYETQYLHMQKKSVNFWKRNGIKPGKKIKQGDIIGFVGQTGLATGPHVCYRFWKNGVQVDPFKENLPPSEPIQEKYRHDFNLIKDTWIIKIDSILYPDEIKFDLDAESSSRHLPL